MAPNLEIRSTRDFFNLCAMWMRQTLVDMVTAPAPIASFRRRNGKLGICVDERNSAATRSQHEELCDALAKLPESEQEVINLLVFYNMTIAEAANVIGRDSSRSNDVTAAPSIHWENC